jgi:hypothetical protein
MNVLKNVSFGACWFAVFIALAILTLSACVGSGTLKGTIDAQYDKKGPAGEGSN